MSDLSAIALFGTSFAVGFSGAISPGPVLAYNIRVTVQHGFLAGPLVAFGHSVVDLAAVAFLALGLARISQSGAAVALIGVIGGAFLVWMGWGMLRKPGRGAPDAKGKALPPTPGNFLAPFLGGMVISLSNPFWTIWWVTVGAAFVTKGLEIGFAGVAAFYLGHILSDFSWYSLVSAGLASGRRFITAGVYKGIMLACGAFIVFMGLYFLATGVSKLR